MAQVWGDKQVGTPGSFRVSLFSYAPWGTPCRFRYPRGCKGSTIITASPCVASAHAEARPPFHRLLILRTLFFYCLAPPHSFRLISKQNTTVPIRTHSGRFGPAGLSAL